MAATNYEVDYNDKRFQNVEAEKNAQLSQMNNAYNEIVNNSDKFYQDQINAVNDYKNTQTQLQQQNTDFAIEQINQQKDQAQKDYTKEQKGSYVDWQKQSNQYGANAEQMASQGLTNTGFSESSQVSMYNTYQNRVSTARESYNKAILNYDNAIKDAQLQNNSKLAEIAFNALQQNLELSLEGFQYKNNLLLEQINKQQEISNEYYNRWQDVQSQINTENQLKEQVRQYEQDYALKNKQYQEDIRQFNEQLAYYREKDAKEYELEIKKLEEQKRQAQQEQANWEKEYALTVSNMKSSGSSSGSSSSSKSSSGSAKMTNSSSKSSSLSSSSSSSSSNNYSSKNYGTILKTARTLYQTSKAKSGSAFVEDYLARAINNKQITTSEAQKILKNIGIK